MPRRLIASSRLCYERRKLRVAPHDDARVASASPFVVLMDCLCREVVRAVLKLEHHFRFDIFVHHRRRQFFCGGEIVSAQD